MRVKVGLAQIAPKLGDIKTNLERHLAYIEQAVAAQVDVLLFPELSLTGYQTQDLVAEVAICAEANDPVFGALLAASRRLDLLVGFVQRDPRNRYYIACAYLSGGECLHIHRKVYPATYTLFDEGRFFAAGEQVGAFDTRFGRMGMLICEDFWHISPPYLLWLDGADVFLFQSASPSRGLDTEDRLGITRWVELVNQAYASLFTNYVVHCNRVGYEDGKNFWGGSSIVDPNGEFLLRGTYFDEALLIQSIDLNQLNRTRSRLPLLRDERPQLLLRELSRILSVTKARP